MKFTKHILLSLVVILASCNGDDDTQNNKQLLLSRITYDTTYNILFTYNEANKFSNCIFNATPNNDDDSEYTKTYNDIGLLKRESGTTEAYLGAFVYYEYNENNILEKIDIQHGSPDALYINEVLFSSPLSFQSNTYYRALTNLIHTGSYNVNAQMDDQEKITYIHSTNTLKNTEEEFFLEYDTQGNLTKFSYNGDVWEISYDNKQSFTTFNPGFPFHNESFLNLGLLQFNLPVNVKESIKYIPLLYNHTNANNPLEYKKNGQVYETFEYEYNASGYPSKITASSNNYEYLLEYVEVTTD